MRSAWFRRLGLAAVAGICLAGTAATTTSCAGTRDEINRVQPGAIKKADLVGDPRNPNDAPEWYVRSLILEVHRTNPWFSDGLQDLVRRVRFEVTENFLVARNAYEYITGSDGKGGVRGKTNNGAIVGMWRIQSHFNIQKAYNQGTGEELNITEENTTDVQWQDREYMRVDWSQNLVNDPNNIFWGEVIFGDMTFRPVPFYEQDPSRPNSSHFEEINGGYFDVASKFIATPQTINYYGYQIPWCLLANSRLHPSTYTEGTYECNDQEVTIRTSFAKVPVGDKSTDYEVGELDGGWDGNIQAPLTLHRSGYDRIYGVTDNTWHRLMMRYNLWQKSHTATVCGENNVKADGDATCAEADPNSVCDLNVKLCTIPYSKREVRPVVWYVDPEMPELFWNATEHGVKQWDTALSRAIAYARETECRRIGGDRAACHGEHFTSAEIDLTKEDEPKLSGVNVLCHNPVRKGDPAACGQEGKKVLKGDIRHHMIAWWKNPSINNPLGVIVWSGDPTTGENIGSLANVFGASVQSYSSRARDYIQLINGDVSPEEYAAGKPAEWYMEQQGGLSTDVPNDPVLSSYKTVIEKAQHGGTAMPKAEIDARIKAVNVKELGDRLGLSKALAGAKTPLERMDRMRKYVNQQSALGTPGFADPTAYAAKLQNNMELAKKGGFENKIFNDQWVKSVDIAPTAATDPTVLDAYSPLRGGNPTMIGYQALQEMEERSRKHLCRLDPGAEMLRFEWMSGYAAKMKAKYPDGATADGIYAERAGLKGAKIDRFVRGKIIYQELLEPTYEFTLIHEMGHLMSMEHDFPASWDSPNFRTEYWTLRAHGKKANVVTCENPDGSTKDPKTCLGPRWLDPVTPEELGTAKGAEHDSIDSYADSSVMDYKFDTIYSPSLGAYDKMAAKFIYTRLAETFDDEQYSLIAKTMPARFIPSLGLMNSEAWLTTFNSFYVHYTEIAKHLNLFDEKRCRKQTPEEHDKGIGALGLVCAPVHKDHAFLRDFDPRGTLPSGFPEWLRMFYAKTSDALPGGLGGKVRWPYKVGDGRLSYVHNYYYDNGADFYEITKDAIELYDLKYMDYFFRKGIRESNIYSAGRSMYYRFFDRVQSLQWNAISDVARETAGGEIDPSAFSGYDDKAKLLSLTLLFDSMQASLLRPQPGAYVSSNAVKNTGSLYDVFTVPEKEGAPGDFKIGIGDARYIDNAYDLTKMFDYESYAKRGGSFLEKPLASIALTDSRPQLSTVARETYLDGRNVMYSFRSAIPRGFDRLVAGVMADDWDTVAPYVDPAAPDVAGMKPLSLMRLWEDDPAKIFRPAAAKIVDPMLGYSIKLPAMYLMLLYQPIDSNMELVNRTRVWLDGGPEAIKVPDAEKISFFDPVDGMQWNAKSFGKEVLAGKMVDIGIGARMMEHANELLMAAFNVETEAVPGAPNPAQKRVKYGPDRRPMKVGGGTLTAADVKDTTAAVKLRQYVGFLNSTRQLLYWLGFGPCGRGEEC